MKQDSIWAGDRVRVTFEGVCQSPGGRFTLDGQDEAVCFSKNAQAADTFTVERVTLAEPESDEFGNCKLCWGHHPGAPCGGKPSLADIQAMLDRAKTQGAIRNDFQEGVMAALLLLTPDISREQFDELMRDKAQAYAESRVAL